MPFAARVTDMHTCPLPTHIGGPVVQSGCPTVIIGGMPAARVGDMLFCSGSLDTIITGLSSVIIGGSPAARQGDSTAHGGIIVSGFSKVIIGG